jgi:hypothetical protein
MRSSASVRATTWWLVGQWRSRVADLGWLGGPPTTPRGERRLIVALLKGHRVLWETWAPETTQEALAGAVGDEDDAAMAGSTHTLQQLDPVGRTAVCAVDGPVRVKRRMRLGRWHCVVELQAAQEARRWQRGQDSDRLARGLTRSPGPPQDLIHPPSIGANQPEPPPE